MAGVLAERRHHRRPTTTNRRAPALQAMDYLFAGGAAAVAAGGGAAGKALSMQVARLLGISLVRRNTQWTFLGDLDCGWHTCAAVSCRAVS